MKGDVYTRLSCVAYSDVVLSLLELPFSTAYWPCFIPPHTGEVHTGGAGKPGAVQKVFCPGAEAEQPKHEGIVWSVHGKYCFAWRESGREVEEEKTKTV